MIYVMACIKETNEKQSLLTVLQINLNVIKLGDYPILQYFALIS